MEDKMRASEHSERLPENYFFDKTAEKHIKYGSHPPLGGRTGAEGGSKRLAEQSEGSDACYLLRRGWGRGVECEIAVCCIAKRCSTPQTRTTYPRARPSLLCPPRGRRERAPASVGKDNAALADTALPSPAYRQEGAHVAAESTAITIVPPKGAKGASASERG